MLLSCHKAHSLVTCTHPRSTSLTPRPQSHVPALPERLHTPNSSSHAAMLCRMGPRGAAPCLPLMFAQRRRPRSCMPGELGQGKGNATKPSLL